MNKSSHRIRKFNPGTFLSDEEVIEQFVVRKRELSIVLEVLRGNIASPSCQHVLVVAPRGRGKTMLLARVAAELNTNDELSKCLLPVRFMEESHEVLNIADFWLETLFHLARESARHDPDLARELRETHADLIDRWREKELADRVLASVLDAADRLGKKLVLMVENLQSIGENVDDDFDWQLRRALQSEPQIMLFATATSRFKGLDDAEQPFFEQFRILDLEPLDTEDCCSLWQVVTGDEVSKDGIRPLEILTGGSPRLLVIVAEFAQHRSLSQLMEELVTLIDDHTEYFRSHLEVLASVERRVYLAVIDLWQPSNAGEIAERARKDVRTVSTLLGRLVNRGAVIVEGTGRKRLYVAAERLYSIYYKLRRERDEAAVVENLIKFMVTFYGIGELYQMFGRLISEVAGSKVIREGFERAIAKRPHGEDPFSRLVWSAIEDISNKATAHAQTTAELCLEKEIETAFEEEAFERVIEIIDSFVASGGVDSSSMPESLMAYILHLKAIAYARLEDLQVAAATSTEMVKCFGDTRDISILWRMSGVLVLGAIARSKLGNFAAAIATCDEVVDRFGTFNDPQFQQLVASALTEKGSAQEKLGDFSAAIVAYDEVIKRFGISNVPELQERVAWSLCKKGDVQVQLGEFTSAVSCYNEVVARFGDSEAIDIEERVAWALSEKAYAQGRLGELVAGLMTYDEVIARFGDSDAPTLQERVAWALSGKGDTHGQLGELVAGLMTYDEVVIRFSDSDAPNLQVPVAWVLCSKGNMQVQLGELALAVSCYDEVVTRFGDSDASTLQVPVAWALSGKGDTHEQLGEFAAALSTYDELIKRFGDVPTLQERVAWALCKKGDMQGRLGELASAIACYDEVIARFGDSDAPALQERVAWTFCAKGDVQVQLDQFAAALSTYDKVIAHFGDSDAPALQIPVARALSGKGNVQVQLGEFVSAIACYDEVIARFSDSEALDLQERVAWSLCKKGDMQGRLGEFVSAIACYDEVVARFGDNEALMLQERVAWAFDGKGDVQGRLGELEAAISAYDEVVASLGDSDATDHQVPVNWTLFKKGMRQIYMGHAKEALRTCEEIKKRLDALTGNEKIEFTWRVRCVRTFALLVQKKRRTAVDAFRSAYAVFVPDNETVMAEMLHFVPVLIAQGVSERDLIEILSSDKEKLDALVPLLVALLQRAGEVVRAPVEVLEVAKDINKDIDAKMAN